MKILLPIVAASALVACAGDELPLATAQSDAQGKRFLAPAAGTGALYIYRTRSGNTADIYVGSRVVGPLNGDYWLRVDLPPGPHDVRCSLPAWGTQGAAEIDIRDGSTTYLLATEYMPNCRLASVNPAQAQPAILAGKRVRELR